MTDWLCIHRGDAPLVLGLPHTGTWIPPEIEARLISPWLGRKDADWGVEQLYGFAASLGASTVRTNVSRTVVDVNRDPAGASLYPGLATTGLCPTETFDGEALYRAGEEPDADETEERSWDWFSPYHEALSEEIQRLTALHGRVVLYDCHSIRSRIPRLFEGKLPRFNIGTNGGASCSAGLVEGVADICAASGHSHVVDGRFRGGYTTRHYGDPANGVHAIQMELACRAYLAEPDRPDASNWPAPFDPRRAAPTIATLETILRHCIDWARSQG